MLEASHSVFSGHNTHKYYVITIIAFIKYSSALLVHIVISI